MSDLDICTAMVKASALLKALCELHILLEKLACRCNSVNAAFGFALAERDWTALLALEDRDTRDLCFAGMQAWIYC